MNRLLTLGLLSWLAAGRVQAQWSDDPTINTPNCTAANDQTYPTIVSDGAGGAIITWTDLRSSNDRIYVQRVHASDPVNYRDV